MKAPYTISLHGCDDSTYIPVELTAEQFALIQEICALSEQHSRYGCQPKMRVEPGHPKGEDEP